MQRRFETRTRGELFIERVIWNMAAGAALAVMVLLLLFSLQWLDHLAPVTDRNTGVSASGDIAEHSRASQSVGTSDRPATEVAAVNRPSG
ncbi:MAG: hypothetical protein ABGX04_12530 [Myxococcales bacterium]|nr:hypothetical protein [Myxococcales bacterium]HIK86590.1 hypothetical protein [Myxococcales bacterium]